MINEENQEVEMTFENRYKIFSVQKRADYLRELYKPYEVRGNREEVLKNSPKYQYPNERKDGYVISQGYDDKGFYAIFLPTEKEYDKIKAFAQIKDKLEKLAEMANLQRELVATNKTLIELNAIEKKIDSLFSYVFGIESKIVLSENKSALHNHIFRSDGFELFEYLLTNNVKPIGGRGRLTQIAFYYWKLHLDKYIVVRPVAFSTWFFEVYNEDLGQIKTLDNIKNADRDKHYSNALDWLKSQK
ncbi:hypothetical protein [Flavobacterium sp. 3HN19-14]|uniref:hypothetical protein n=1 Tax=Flavobacterium sp. 3HN19-14 TaxID=3448133 RepID=UPI003EE12FCC